MTELQSLAAYPVGPPPTTATAAIDEVVAKGKKPEDERFTFWDFLDVINPLQHIPVVNSIYREITGDEIKAPAKLLGSTIIGGPIGLGVAMADVIVEDATGKDMGGHAMAMFRGEDSAPDAPTAPTALAQAVAASTTAVAQSSGREFIPSAFSAASSASMIMTDTFKDDEEAEAESTAQTEASIAAAAAAAPSGLVFMPLAGRQPVTGSKPVQAIVRDQQFFALRQTDRFSGAAPGPESTSRQAAKQTMNQNAVAQIQASLSGSVSGNTGTLDPLLEATKPRGDTGIMPVLDPFAAQRTVADESGAVAVPAWFDRAMIDGMEKYRALQTQGQAVNQAVRQNSATY